MSKVWDKRPFEYKEVDIKARDMEKWKALYEFDVPVLHVERNVGDEKVNGDGEVLGTGGRKVKHRSTVEELEGVMDVVQKGT
ncbi:uncharacterized protein RCC_08384 [Ramularia collo-cygni]|uniref:Glutaredoxin-like protein n=1 Tax=Ramularia collo-cygni TaxID=112498 RepID=A0A2D3VHP4_9PEZI|nr:uncharacterized protein RCC_08384 [Ramularia collo-cygni]CZT22679.1 uncharacterized protein RCC_08384 [Ramularia collo-cygni]